MSKYNICTRTILKKNVQAEYKSVFIFSCFPLISTMQLKFLLSVGERQTWLVRRLQWWATANEVSMNISGMDVRSSMLCILRPSRCRSKACPWTAYEKKKSPRHFLSFLLSDPSLLNDEKKSLRYTCWSDESWCSSGAAAASLCSVLGATENIVYKCLFEIWPVRFW